MNTLVEALHIAGELPVLARKLRVPSKQLGSWIEGEIETPGTVLERALNFIREARATVHIFG